MTPLNTSATLRLMISSRCDTQLSDDLSSQISNYVSTHFEKQLKSDVASVARQANVSETLAKSQLAKCEKELKAAERKRKRVTLNSSTQNQKEIASVKAKFNKAQERHTRAVAEHDRTSKLRSAIDEVVSAQKTVQASRTKLRNLGKEESTASRPSEKYLAVQALIENSEQDFKVKMEYAATIAGTQSGHHKLSALRKVIKDRIERYCFGTQQMFEVWINEDDSAHTVDEETVNACLEEIRKSNLIIILYTGEAGYAGKKDGSDGICLLEAQEAFGQAPHSTMIMDIQNLVVIHANEREARNNARMEEWFETMAPFTSRPNNLEEILTHIDSVIAKTTTKLTKSGHAFFLGKGAGSMGPGLAWSRMSLSERQDHMIRSLLTEEGGPINPILFKAPMANHSRLGIWTVDKTLAMRMDDDPIQTADLLVVLSAVPGPINQSAPREIWGRPDLSEHKWPAKSESTRTIDDASRTGPIHIVCVRGGITEIQAQTLLNNPDAMVTETSFGVWASDEVQGTQFLLLKNCMTAASIREALKNAEGWLIKQNELARATKRAEKRREVLEVLRTPINYDARDR